MEQIDSLYFGLRAWKKNVQYNIVFLLYKFINTAYKTQ